MHRDTQVAMAAEKLNEKAWALCDISKGLDCLNFMLSFYEDMGITFPDQFEGVTRENYADLWIKNPSKAKETMKRFLFSLGEEVNQADMARGDLVVFEGKKFPCFPGIYLGNGHILIAFDIGTYIIPMRFIREYIIGVRKII